MEFVIIPRNALDVESQTAYNQVWLNFRIPSLNSNISLLTFFLFSL